MARKKESKEINPEVAVAETEKTVQATVEKAEIPGYAKKALKLFQGYEKLYVSKCGGVFTENTPESIRGNAELFVNPYFNK